MATLPSRHECAPPWPRERFEAQARIAKALAHASRLQMLDLLAEGEHCVQELTDLVGADQSTVSKHLAVLRQAGLVIDRRQGSTVFYRLRVRCLRGFWACLETVLRENVRAQRAAVEGRREEPTAPAASQCCDRATEPHCTQARS